MTEIEGVVPALAQALAKRGYETLTPVQQAVLGAEMDGADALVSAQTGSGKTVAFGLAMAPTLLEGAERLPRADLPVALAVAPTRELALQVKRELDWLYEFAGASVTSCVGGMDMRTERMNLQRGAHIVVGTPGRLRDHIERGSLDMSAMKVVVLDEADEMLDLGFREDLEFILQSAPQTRRTLMFSATVPPTIASMAKRYQRDAVRLTTASESRQHGDIEYRALTCAPTDRENAIINVLRHANPKSAIVFCGTRATVNHLTSRFTNRGLSVVALSGELNQGARTHALQALRDGRASVCIATDVAARGIDLPNLELVIHADLPKNPESLLHRSGRTGRAGRKGISALIVPYPRRRHTERLLANANIKATWGKPPSADEVLALDRQRILEDTDLTGETTEEEQAFAVELLAKYDANAVAIAFLRKHMAGLTAPEELLDGPAAGERHERPERGDRGRRDDRGDRGPRPDRGDRPERDRGDRAGKRPGDFDSGTWIRLSVGRHHSAEPRWLLPMLCRAGNLTKNHVGAIRIHENETHVELHPEAAIAFLEAVGPSRKIEKSITVDKIEGMPTEPAAAPRKERAERPERAPRKPKPQGTLRAAPRADVAVSAPAPAAAPQPVQPQPVQPQPVQPPAEKPREAAAPGEKPVREKLYKDTRGSGAPSFKREVVRRDGNPAERPLKRRRDGDTAPAARTPSAPVDATPIATAQERPKKAWKGKEGAGKEGAGKSGKKFGDRKFGKPHPAKTRLGLDKPKKAPHRKG
ncbi:DEAD/DEAH box helicase [Thalassobaculum sp. OXR-137]|uniref:DEAD/DEAH box helicase n=1 Tax=Thalassobaculum sp. OXR-137 TaxID=3100173 RepID=UPI002AC89AF9|nr:DEAD/DEAH box helicase [Thalassobaculum sp. OXR-137]WPZ32649.1 DEAD/DEAH box helicase [Thalassobaculum sp. OXR-137]